MPRTRRFTPPASVQHVIARFVDGRFLLDLPGARRDYLDRFARAMTRQRHDCRPLAFSLMSSHVHWAIVMGQRPLADLLKSVHSGFATWVRRKLGGRGPIFAERFKSIGLEPELAAHLVAYIHNNEVRAGCVDSAQQSRWSSHACYGGTIEPPPWLHVDERLHLCGFSATSRGRQQFVEWTESRVSSPRNPILVGEGDAEARLELLRDLPGSTQLLSPSVASLSELKWTPVTPPGSPVRDPWRGRADAVLEIGSRLAQVRAAELRCSGRQYPLPMARGALLTAWRDFLGRRQVDMARLLGMSESAASRAVARTRHEPESLALAEAIAVSCRKKVVR